MFFSTAIEEGHLGVKGTEASCEQRLSVFIKCGGGRVEDWDEMGRQV